MRSPGVVWIKAAVVYFIMGVSLGIYMGASGDHLLTPRMGVLSVGRIDLPPIPNGGV
jgi:hypothetical protein